ncbi:type VII secretion target [Actinoplanes sp. NPDC049265]|uniref:type VII secretion target n=1 Tax=Actinoplanes sp. NPDC049265 TaxID=3363902 RepID=UPI00371930CE
MADQFGVRPGDLVAHAATVEEIAGRVDTAAQAGAATRAGNEAYGKLCVMVPMLLNVLQDRLVDGIGAAAESLRGTGSRLRVTAADYEAADEDNASGVRSAGS